MRGNSNAPPATKDLQIEFVAHNACAEMNSGLAKDVPIYAFASLLKQYKIYMMHSKKPYKLNCRMVDKLRPSFGEASASADFGRRALN